MINFQELSPDVMELPEIEFKSSEFTSDALDNIVKNIIFYIQSNKSIYGPDKENEDKDENELLAIYLDEYFNTDRGRMDYETLDSIAGKLGTKYLEASEILSNEISESVTKLNEQIQTNLKNKLEACEGYNDVNKIKFDYVDLSSFDSITSLAIDLCKKYSYNVNNLTVLNVGTLYKKITLPQSVKVTDDTINSVLGEITITIKNDNENAEEPNVEVNTDNNIPTEVEINGEDKTDDVCEDEGCKHDGEGEHTEHDNLPEDTNIDVNADSEENKENITVTINGQKVNKALMDGNQDVIPDPEYDQDQEMKTELYKLIVEACFNQDSFKKLYNKFLNMHNSLDNKPLQLATWFTKFPVKKIYNLEKTSLSDTNRELLESNLESIEDLQRCVAVNIDLVMRKKNDVLIVTPRLLNLPVLDDAKNRGIDVYTWIRDYLRVYHNRNINDSIYSYVQHSPVNSGITLEKLIITRPLVEDSLAKFKDTVKHKEKDLYLDLLKKSFSDTLSTYVNKIVDITPNHIPIQYKTPSNFRRAATESIKSLANQLTQNNLSNVEDSLYSFYFQFWYKDTLVEKIYKDTSYHLQADLHLSGIESLDKTSEANIRAKVMSNIVLSLLKQLF